MLRLAVADDPAAAAAGRIVATLRQANALGRRTSIALSGGETPWRTLAHLRRDDLDWRLVDLFQVDERIVPHDHADRNLRRLRDVLTVPAVIHPMPVEAADLDRAAAEYAHSLPTAFDIVQLGLGSDGHTASLVPDDPVLEATTDTAITRPYPSPKRARRMTLTFPTINRARTILWLVTGAGKRKVLSALLEGTADIPANRVARDQAMVIADWAAAG